MCVLEFLLRHHVLLVTRHPDNPWYSRALQWYTDTARHSRVAAVRVCTRALRWRVTAVDGLLPYRLLHELRV